MRPPKCQPIAHARVSHAREFTAQFHLNCSGNTSLHQCLNTHHDSVYNIPYTFQLNVRIRVAHKSVDSRRARVAALYITNMCLRVCDSFVQTTSGINIYTAKHNRQAEKRQFITFR